MIETAGTNCTLFWRICCWGTAHTQLDSSDSYWGWLVEYWKVGFICQRYCPLEWHKFPTAGEVAPHCPHMVSFGTAGNKDKLLTLAIIQVGFRWLFIFATSFLSFICSVHLSFIHPFPGTSCHVELWFFRLSMFLFCFSFSFPIDFTFFLKCPTRATTTTEKKDNNKRQKHFMSCSEWSLSERREVLPACALP